jgi:hypothetical protein
VVVGTGTAAALHGRLHESWRGGGAWEFLAIGTESPYLDERPLLVASQPEVREYRMRFWDKGRLNGEWTDVAKSGAKAGSRFWHACAATPPAASTSEIQTTEPAAPASGAAAR